MLWGLLLCSLGIYMAIQANIGLAPWDAFSMGLSYVTNISYGDASIYTGLVIIAIDLLLREKIGFGTLLNTILIGKMVDLLEYVDLIPLLDNFWWGLALLLLGQGIMCVGAHYYISAAMGCGPRDSLMVAMGKRVKRIPVGLVRIFIEGSALLCGWLMGAKVGLGTLIAAVGVGFILELVFRLYRFDVKAVRHESFLDTLRNWGLLKKSPSASEE
ncbi:MAG: hypothetical protein Q4B50_05705 [Bacillota bacterium]|nr:hypothetical protein [Bacillota bacterium]